MGAMLEDRRIVIVNQAVNYLTIGICNAFSEKFQRVSLITGSIHVQGEELSKEVRVTWINRWYERPAWKKMISYLKASAKIYWLLMSRFRGYEVFFISLPPMGYLLSLLVPHRSSMLIWDVYPDVFKVTGMSTSHLLYRGWALANRVAFKRAFKLFTIGYRMAELLEKYVDRRKITVTPIWSIFQSNQRVCKTDNPFVAQHRLQGKFVVQYSGNIGLTHKVELLVELAERLKGNDQVVFQIIGRGPRVVFLRELVEKKKLPN